MIQPSFEVVNSVSHQSYLLRIFEEEAFISPYHYHPEFELTLITKGSGKRYIGNHMANFDEGDLVFLGGNLPHCWKTDPVNKGMINAGSIVIQFTHDFLGTTFFDKPEMMEIQHLLKRGNHGIEFNKSVVPEIEEALRNMIREEGRFRKLFHLFDILFKLATTSEYQLLTRQSTIFKQKCTDLERLNTVYSYIIDNFKTGVSLNGAARLANMTPNAFCKYFKKSTRKTFIEVVVDYRLHYSTTQLINTNKSIGQICYDCGFNDVAHFSRMFKMKMKTSPLQYRKIFVKDL